MVRFVGALLIALSLGIGLAWAQNKPETLTELDKAQLTIVNLMGQLTQALKDLDDCHAQLSSPRFKVNSDQVQQALKDTKAKIEAAHPGYSLDLATGSLVPLPPEEDAKAPQKP